VYFSKKKTTLSLVLSFLLFYYFNIIYCLEASYLTEKQCVITQEVNVLWAEGEQNMGEG